MLKNSAANAAVGKTWLDTQLLSAGLETQEKFFESVTVASKPTAAVLPVFFGKVPACTVDEPTFDVMKELNPQVGQQLQVLAISDTFADTVICLREDGWLSPQDKTDTIQSLQNLHSEPVGQQICTLFKIDRLVPFEDAQLDTVRKLRATYAALQNAAARANPPAPALSQIENHLPPPGQSRPERKNEL